MATIWKETPDGFAPAPLQFTGGSAALGISEDSECQPDTLRVVPFRDGNKSSLALLVGQQVAVRVNGWPVIGGIRVLDHKDEITIGAQRMYFSAESQPVVATYRNDGSRRRPRCPICRAEVQDDQQIVCCPGCSRIYHQTTATADVQAKPCWTYAAECRFCGHPTSMSGEPTWRPDEVHNQ
jgi:hypothetical protein